MKIPVMITGPELERIVGYVWPSALLVGLIPIFIGSFAGLWQIHRLQKHCFHILITSYTEKRGSQEKLLIGWNSPKDLKWKITRNIRGILSIRKKGSVTPFFQSSFLVSMAIINSSLVGMTNNLTLESPC